MDNISDLKSVVLNTLDLFSEKIYIGQRIRDIMYIKDKKLIILALEENGELGIIKAIDSN